MMMNTKVTFTILVIGFMEQIAFPQIFNSGFEDWVVSNGLENPEKWETNHAYPGFLPIYKTTQALAGNYSVAISSTARDIYGLPTQPACVHQKVVPSVTYSSLHAKVRVDSINRGEIAIRVKQRSAAGIYEKIGGWTSNVQSPNQVMLEIPIQQSSFDTILLEIWAINDQPLVFNPGFSSATIDDVQLSTTVSTNAISDLNEDVICYPNPTMDIVTLKIPTLYLGEVVGVNVRNIHGSSCQQIALGFNMLGESAFSLSSLESGLYLIHLVTMDGKEFPISTRVFKY